MKLKSMDLEPNSQKQQQQQQQQPLTVTTYHQQNNNDKKTPPPQNNNPPQPPPNHHPKSKIIAPIIPKPSIFLYRSSSSLDLLDRENYLLKRGQQSGVVSNINRSRGGYKQGAGAAPTTPTPTIGCFGNIGSASATAPTNQNLSNFWSGSSGDLSRCHYNSNRLHNQHQHHQKMSPNNNNNSIIDQLSIRSNRTSTSGPNSLSIAKSDSAGASSTSSTTPSPSPRFRLKFHQKKKLFGGDNNSSDSKSGAELKGHQVDNTEVIDYPIILRPNQSTKSSQINNLKYFSHYDCPSITSDISYSAKLKNLLNRRRNTTTGASAASNNISISGSCSFSDFKETNSNSIIGAVVGSIAAAPDTGDWKSNHLVENCPYFRNEVGGEGEIVIVIGAATVSKLIGGLHRSQLASGINLLEFKNGGSHWDKSKCFTRNQLEPRNQLQLEGVDGGAGYYEEYFYGRDHSNWFGLDDVLGPIAVSLRKEKVAADPLRGQCPEHYLYRVIVRSTELTPLRGCILEAAIPTISNPKPDTIYAKQVVEWVVPEINTGCLFSSLPSPTPSLQLLKLDAQPLSSRHKIGILYTHPFQPPTEDEMYNNQFTTPNFEEFLDTFSNRVKLKGFKGYTGGLDTRDDSQGEWGRYTQVGGEEIMFHVVTELPWSGVNRQQLMRKRHIGNDIVTIIFQEPDSLPFTPKNIRSQFQHVFIIVRLQKGTGSSSGSGLPPVYEVAVSRSKEVPLFGPKVPEGGVFKEMDKFKEWIVSKVINAESASYRSEKFTTMATRTRSEYLKELVNNYTTEVRIGEWAQGQQGGQQPHTKNNNSSSSRFSLLTNFSLLNHLSLSSGSKKSAKSPVPAPMNSLPTPEVVNFLISNLPGGLTWPIRVSTNQSKLELDGVLGISMDSVVVMTGHGASVGAVVKKKEVIWGIGVRAVVGWGYDQESHVFSLYYHRGEEVIQFRASSDNPEVDLGEIQLRLGAVCRNGVGVGGHILRRRLNGGNNGGGEWGLHLSEDEKGVVVGVVQNSSGGQGQGSGHGQNGVQRGDRIVEISGILVSPLTHEELINKLRTTPEVSLEIKVIPGISGGRVRSGCVEEEGKNCPGAGAKWGKGKPIDMNDYHDYYDLSPIKKGNYYLKKNSETNKSINGAGATIINSPSASIPGNHIKKYYNNYYDYSIYPRGQTQNRDLISSSPPRSSNSSGYGTGERETKGGVGEIYYQQQQSVGVGVEVGDCYQYLKSGSFIGGGAGGGVAVSVGGGTTGSISDLYNWPPQINHQKPTSKESYSYSHYYTPATRLPTPPLPPKKPRSKQQPLIGVGVGLVGQPHHNYYNFNNNHLNLQNPPTPKKPQISPQKISVDAAPALALTLAPPLPLPQIPSESTLPSSHSTYLTEDSNSNKQQHRLDYLKSTYKLKSSRGNNNNHHVIITPPPPTQLIIKQRQNKQLQHPSASNSSSSSTLQDELIKLINHSDDGDELESSVGSGGGIENHSFTTILVGSGESNGSEDSSSIIQQEEQQQQFGSVRLTPSPSIITRNHLGSVTTTPTATTTPLPPELYSLFSRVSTLELELQKEKQSKSVLSTQVENLQVENAKLQEESSTTQVELNKFKMLLLRGRGIGKKGNSNGKHSCDDNDDDDDDLGFRE